MDTKLIEQLYGELVVAYECSADEKMDFIHFPQQLSRLLGYNCCGGTKHFRSMMDIISSDELEKRRNMLKSQLETNDIDLLLPLTKRDGSTEWFFNRGRKVGDSVIGILVPSNRIKSMFDRQSDELYKYKTNLEKTKHVVGNLQRRAEQDSLTKLYNADTTKSLCTDYLAESGKMCAVIIFDLDGFKSVNDVLGHIEGDRVLTEVAKTVKTLFRSGDIIGRVGGDEFLVLMKDIQSSAIVEKKCADLVKAISDNIKCPQSVNFGCSVGAAVAPTGIHGYEELFCCADRAMYHVKNNGRNNYCVRQMICTHTSIK